MKYFLVILFIISQCFISLDSFAQCKAENTNCVPVGQWKLSLGLGAGVYTNPLHNSKNIPLILAPSISYYGERVFFQNNTLGYTLLESEQFAFSIISKANVEKAFFTRWHPQNVFIPSIANGFLEEDSNNGFVEAKPRQKINPNTVKKRRWALDAGLQINWFVNDSINVELQILHDVNSVYDGFNANAKFSKLFFINKKSSIEATLGVQWNSENLVNYYYGIDESDTHYRRNQYQGKVSVNPYISMGYAYQISPDWTFKTYIKRKQLHRNTYLSPLVEKTHVDLIFIGFFYEF